MTASTYPRHYQRLAWFFIVLFVSELVYPNVALALTSGPTQPEVTSFEPVGTTEMVNLFSGDFTYNIPLFEVPGPEGGYPVNLFYNSVTNMDEEASWTGLGWNINIGSLGRMMRGLPDDFSGEEQVERKLHMKPQQTVSVGGRVGMEVAGLNTARTIGLSASLSQSFTWDSYRGVGMETGTDIGLSFSKKNADHKLGASLGLNISTLEGTSMNSGFSISRTTTSQNQGEYRAVDGSTTGKFNAGVSFNGRDGLSGITLGYTRSTSNDIYNKNSDGEFKYTNTAHSHNSYSSSISFSRPSFTPAVSIPWAGFNISGSLSFSPGGMAVYFPMGVQGSYSFQDVLGNGLWQSSNAYGYNYLHSVDDPANENFTSDINRSNTGTISYHSRFLPTPVTTYDVYNIMGQGVGGMYRAHRSEFGWIHDKSLYSATAGGRVGVQGGPWLNVGVDAHLNYSDQYSTHWALEDAVKYGHEYNNRRYDIDYEPFYYRMAGDMAADETTTYDFMGSDEPLRLKRAGFGYQKKFEDNNRTERIDFSSGNTNINNRTGRAPRSMSVQPVRNIDIRNQSGNSLLNEFNVKFFTSTVVSNYQAGPTQSVYRPENRQNAGFTVLGNNGVRWNYALPVMNKQHREVMASHDTHTPGACIKRVDIVTQNGNSEGDENQQIKVKHLRTNEYLEEKKIPEYAHSYLLTSVVGTDYADIDGEPGPSDGDVGYWMKTNYVRTSDNYQWRAPFTGANYNEGQENLEDDNNVSFMWGERENYLPASLETKTHIAYFYVSRRADARGAKYYIQNSTTSDPHGAYSYKLDKIELYSKNELKNKTIANANPLKTIHFAYDYTLCPNIENNDGSVAGETGKLTLKKVWFTHEGSNRGSLSPYKFEYNQHPTQSNYYAYNDLNIDRWGCFRQNWGNSCYAMDAPYVEQGQHSTPATIKELLDKDIAAWHINKIVTPSGATINLELERDDYAYVQDKVATQMMRIDPQTQTYSDNNGGIMDRIYFQLEEPIPAGTNAQKQLERYIEDLPIMQDPFTPENNSNTKRQVYLHLVANLRNGNNNTTETIPVFAFLKKDNNGREIHFADPGATSHTRAYVELENAKIKAVEDDPISVFAWMYLRNNLPSKIYEWDLGGQTGDQAFMGLFGAISSIEAIVKGYYRYARDKNFGNEISPISSFIRLNTPDKIKYGGNIRVKQVTLEDQWDANQTSTIGVTYDYTTTDEEGNTISSGVVENEPALGYEACALQYATIFYEWIGGGVNDKIHVDLLPLNQNYYPGASVGYSKVTVRSIASNLGKEIAEGNTTEAANDLAAGFAKSGQTVNEYYTCKDFPIITSSTTLSKEATAPWLTQALALATSLLVKTDIQLYTGTQGYSIELNDMHGKPKGTSTYAQNADGTFSDQKLTSVEYKYHASRRVKTGYNTNNQSIVYGLDNEVKVLLDEGPTGVMFDDRLVGVEQEFFADSRRNISRATSGGINFDGDVHGLFPIPFFLPGASVSNYDTRTSVTNKIIKRHGIVKEIHAYDGQSHIVTTNKVYDAQTGQPVLTTVDNQLDGKIYNYSIPAHLVYESMGPAAANWGRRLKGSMTATGCNGYFDFTNSVLTPTPTNMVAGDEYILVITSGTYVGTKMRAVYMGRLRNNSGAVTNQFDLINSPALSGTTSVELINTRSGNRNLLTAPVAQYTTVDTDNNGDANPLADRTAGTCRPTIVEFTRDNVNGVDVVIAEPVPGSGVGFQTINNVLSASANSYRDHWDIDQGRYCASNSVTNPYLKGERGTWRSQSSYAYIADRSFNELASSTAPNVNIKTSGVVDNVPIFNHQNPFFEYCQNKWVRTEDITRYNINGNPVEARDVLGNYQAEIYGHQDNLVVAKGANANYYEIGYEGFEGINRTGTVQSVANATGYYDGGNLNFLPKSTNCPSKTYQTENYRLSYPLQVGANNICHVLVRQDYGLAVETFGTHQDVVLNLKNAQGEEKIVNVPASNVQLFPLEMDGESLQVPGLGIVLDNNTQDEFSVYEIDLTNNASCASFTQGQYWAGSIELTYGKLALKLAEFGRQNANIEVSNISAHTGQYALSLFGRGQTGSVVFPQRSVRLQKGEEYVISFWIYPFSDLKLTGAPHYNYAELLTLETYWGVGAQQTPLTPSGPVLEGWQKVEHKFTYNGDPNQLNLVFNRKTDDPTWSYLLVDDVRLFPADGHVQTYAYDPVDYKLRATLDDNNYATFYLYDAEGNLLGVKRETEQGIKTIQESRSYIKTTN